MKTWCLHGAVGMTADWDEFAERMCAAGQEVCMVDLWGFVEEGACSFADFAAELVKHIGGRVVFGSDLARASDTIEKESSPAAELQDF